MKSVPGLLLTSPSPFHRESLYLAQWAAMVHFAMQFKSTWAVSDMNRSIRIYRPCITPRGPGPLWAGPTTLTKCNCIQFLYVCQHRGKNDDRQCKLCRGECESVVHVLWECPAYDSIRNNFMVELENLLGGRFGEFSTLDNFNKASFILGFENWNRDDFKALLMLVKSFVLLIWETRKKELYGDQDCVVSGCSCSCPLTGGLTSSACVCGCVVNGVSATAAT